MKLFKSLLVAPATLGLLAPMSAATANEITINDFNPAIENTLLAGGEGLVDDDSHDGGFSETTTASFSADFAIGAVDGSAAQDAVQALYGFQIDLNTSFTGEDSLDIAIDAGNGGNGLTLIDLNEGTADDVLTLDGISYTFPLGDKVTIGVGNDYAGSSLYSTACVYGGPTKNLDDCGNNSSAMDASEATGLSASFDLGNGFAAAIGYEGEGDNTDGLMTTQGTDTYGGQVSYSADQFAASVTYANYDTPTTDTTYVGLNGYWTPEETGTAVPSISVGYETGNPGNTTVDTTHYFVGLQWDEMGPGTLGLAFGTQQHYAENATEYLEYEAFYSYPINDGMTITPIIFVRETASGSDDETGLVVKTSFSF